MRSASPSIFARIPGNNLCNDPFLQRFLGLIKIILSIIFQGTGSQKHSRSLYRYNRMKFKFGILLSALVLLVSTCTKDVHAPSACFQEKILPIFVSNCAMSGCHNSTDREEGYDLSNYEGIMKGVRAKRPLLSEVYKVIKGNNPSMPAEPYAKLSAEQVNLIKLWINAGAPNSSNCSTCDSSDYRYDSKISTIMTTWCLGCHNNSNPGGNVFLGNYQAVVDAATSGRLLGSVQHLSGYSPMPQQGGKLDDCSIRAIEKWIAKGYPQN